jgi:protein N-terminal amidase
MKIATLQFSPRLGDVEGNIRRADALLKRERKRLEGNLDLLVLPELAFTGEPFLAFSFRRGVSLWII